MKQFSKLIICTVLMGVAVISAGCSPKAPRTVVIISTNDIHASIDNFPRLATLVEQYRAEYGDNVILADAGDRWTGNPYVDWTDKPFQPVIQIMDSLGYDIATFGNHEFDKGSQVLADRIADMTFPVVCANIIAGESPIGNVAPYKIFRRGGLKIAFVGVVTNAMNGHPDGNEDCFTDLSFVSPETAAERYKRLASKSDVLVLLSHAGLTEDSIIAATTPDYDLIIGGHTHDLVYPPKTVGKTVITQTRSNLRYAGVTIITDDKGKLTINNTVVKLDTVAPSPRYVRMVERFKQNPELSVSIGTIAESFTGYAVPNFMTDATRAALSTDIALYHRGGIRIDSIPSGKVQRATLGLIDPFGSRMIVVPMTPDEIKGLIANKYNDKGNPKESHRVDLYPSGMKYSIVVGASGDAVNVVLNPERKDTVYKVAMPDYVYNNYNFKHVEQAVADGVPIAEIMQWYLGKNSPLKADRSVRATEIK